MGFLLAIFIFILMIPGVTALAKPDLTVKVSAGIDGKAKYEKGAPISITVENSGTHFSGDLVVDVMESYQQGMGRAFPLEIGTGETKTVSFIVHNMEGVAGMYGGPNTKTIYFYEGGWKKGKEIKHSGAQSPTATMYHDEKMILTFTNNIDRLVSLKSVDIGSSSNVQLIDSEKVGVMNFPEDARGWGVIDYIILDEYAFADLQSEKQLALLEWVENGGIIIIGSSDNLEDEVGVFSPYLPMKLTGQIDIVPTVLNEWANTTGFEEEIRVYSSELNEDAVTLVQEKDDLLVAHKKLGQGLVIQTAFSLGDEPLAKSPGMTAFWNALFTAGENVIFSPFNQYGHDPLNQLSYTVGHSNELFSSFKVSAPLIFGIIALYIIIIIPILYFILKRKDKREYAWWIIPAIALLTSVAIFGYGAKDRIGRAQIQHTAILNVETDGNIKGYFAESLLSNKSGNYIFKAPHGTSLTASPQSFMFNTSANMFHKRAILENNAEGTSLHFRNVGYWNVASVYGETNLKDVGGIVNDLSFKTGMLAGSITNDFPFELKDVAIWAGSDFISLDDIGAGETVEINETLKTTLLGPRLPYQAMYSTAANDDLMKIRKNNALTFFSDNMSLSNKPVLIGYTDTQVVPVTLENVKTSLSALTMIVHPIKSEHILQGKITADENMIEMYMAISEQGYDYYIIENPIEEAYQEGIEYTQTWRLPEELVTTKVDWATMKLSNLDNQLYRSKLLNNRTGEYELIESNEMIITENIMDYITEDGILSLHIIFNSGRYSTGEVLPKLELVGEVSK